MTKGLLYLVVSLALGDLTLAESKTYEPLNLTCPYRWDHVYWVRDPYLVAETFWFDSTVFTSEGRDLINRTEVWFSSHQHVIAITLNDEDNDVHWRCCVFYQRICSNWLYVRAPFRISTTVPDGTDGPQITTNAPESSQLPFVNGTLTLKSTSETPTVGQMITLSCTIDAVMGDDKWTVVWARNETAVIVTDRNSSIINPRNLPDGSVYFPNGSVYKGIIWNMDNFLNNVRVSSDAFQQNITFPVSSSLIGQSFWNCGNPFLSKTSNTLCIETTGQSASANIVRYTSTAYIVTGSVSGIGLIGFIVVMVMVAYRCGRRMKDAAPTRNKKTNEKAEDSTVIRDNMLWARSDESIHDQGFYDDE